MNGIGSVLANMGVGRKLRIGFGLIMLLVAIGVFITSAMVLYIFRNTRAAEPDAVASTL